MPISDCEKFPNRTWKALRLFIASDNFHTVEIHTNRDNYLKISLEVALLNALNSVKILKYDEPGSQIMLTCSSLTLSRWPCSAAFRTSFLSSYTFHYRSTVCVVSSLSVRDESYFFLCAFTTINVFVGVIWGHRLGNNGCCSIWDVSSIASFGQRDGNRAVTLIFLRLLSGVGKWGIQRDFDRVHSSSLFTVSSSPPPSLRLPELHFWFDCPCWMLPLCRFDSFSLHVIFFRSFVVSTELTSLIICLFFA